MCRFAAYLGPEMPVSTLLYDPPRGLSEQAHSPREQIACRVNVDGTGVAWWHAGERMPLRYVTVRPPWSDPNLPALSRRLRSRIQLAAVRSATAGIPVGPSNVHPFEFNHHVFAHNGFLERFRDTTGRPLLQALPDHLHAAMDAVSDSLVLFMTALSHLESAPDGGIEAALAATIRDAVASTRRANAMATLNMVWADGERIVATRFASGRVAGSLHVLEGGERWPDGLLVASEPLDDDPRWTSVPESSVVVLDSEGLRVRPLDVRA